MHFDVSFAFSIQIDFNYHLTTKMSLHILFSLNAYKFVSFYQIHQTQC